MKNLFYGLVYGNQPIISTPSLLPSSLISKEDFETICRPEDQTINQIHRHIKLLNEFKNYIVKSNANEKTNKIYYNYIQNTIIHEYEHVFDQSRWQEHNKPVTYTMIPGPLFGKLYPYKTSYDQEDYFRTLALLDL
jgi:hypothetical protein